MKLNFKAILFAAIAAFMSASCVEGTLDLRRPGLENVDATKVELTTLVSSDAARVRPFYVYELTLSSEDESVVLDAKFVSDGQPLHAAVYSPAAYADAHRNTYVTGEDGTTLTVNGVVCQVVSGDIKVTAEAGAYTVSGIVEVSVPATGEDAVPTTAYYDLTWGAEPVTVKFKELPTLTTLTKVLTATSNVANGTNTVTVQLSTDGWSQETDMTTWVTTYTGTGAYLAVDFYSEDGYLAAGTYKAGADPANPQPGEFVVGYDTTVDWGWGPMEMKDWGTCWWTVDNAAPVAEKILSGEIYVAYDKKSKAYTIDIDNGTQYAKFVGEIPALTKPESTGGNNDEVLNADIVIEKSGLKLIKADDTAANTTSDGAALSGVTLWYVALQDETGNNAAIFDLVTEEGSESLAGEYKVTSYPDEVGEAGNGFDINMPEWGFVMSGGTILYDNGNTYVIDAETSTVTVEEKDGAYKIVVKGTTTSTDMTTYESVTKTIAARYIVGDWKNDGGNGGDFEGTELTQFFSLTDYSANGLALIGIELGTEGITATEMDYFGYKYMQLGGTGNHLKVEFYSADGTLAPGTYVPCATEGSPGEGEFNYGYDYVSDWGTSVYGSCWSTYESDQVTAQEKISDGTITVEEDGGVYTITIESSTATARYVGKLSAE